MFKNKVKRIIVPLVALVVTLAMTITSTYAWFTMSAAPELQGMDMEITAGTYTLLISINQASDWDTVDDPDFPFRSSIDSTAINAMIATLHGTDANGPVKLGAYTTEDGLDFTNEAGTSILPNKNYSVEGVDGGWVSFHIRFRAVEKLEVILSPESKVHTPEDFANPLLKPVFAWEDLTGRYGITGTIEKDTAIYTSAAYASRFSFTGNDGTDDNTYIWNPTETDSIIDMRGKDATGTPPAPPAHPDPSGESVYQVFDNPASIAGTPAENFANDYRKAFLNDTSFADVPETVLRNSIVLNNVGDTPSVLVLLTTSANGFNQGTIQVNIWLEGWDANCFNAILSDVFTTSLIFNGQVPTP